MPNQHKNPLLGWRPPAELSAWARAEAERRGVTVGFVLTEALAAYRASGTFYVLACLECSEPGKPLVLPFSSPAERGRWAAEHTSGTGHDRWWVHDDPA